MKSPFLFSESKDTRVFREMSKNFGKELKKRFKKEAVGHGEMAHNT